MKILMIGLAVATLSLAGCKNSKPAGELAAEPAGEGDDNDGPGGGGGPGGGFRGGHRRMCEGDKAEARITRMQKCQSETTAACNTQVYGAATPSKDTICGDPEKMKQVWKCVREKYAGDREKMRADRKKARECIMGAGGPAE